MNQINKVFNIETEKYKILTDSQTFPTGFKFPKEQFGTTKLGKPHMCSFNPNWLEEFKTDGLIYSVTEDGAYCKYCKLFPGGERGLLVEWMNSLVLLNIVSQVIQFFESSPKRTSVLTAEIERTESKRKEIKAVVQN